MGRVYLPQEDLRQYGWTAEDLLSGAAFQAKSEQLRELLTEEGRRAEGYYASADALLPLIDLDSRPALWVLVKIYRGLLHRMQARNFEVFSTKVALPSGQKLSILAQGLGQVALHKVFPGHGRAAQ